MEAPASPAKTKPSGLQREQTVLGLLLLSCVLSLLLLIVIPQPEHTSLSDAGIIDRAIERHTSHYGISKTDIRTREIKVDSLFSRKEFTIRVSPDFPGTTVHARLAAELKPLRVGIEGERFFPENRLELRFIYAGKLVRTAVFIVETD